MRICVSMADAFLLPGGGTRLKSLKMAATKMKSSISARASPTQRLAPEKEKRKGYQRNEN